MHTHTSFPACCMKRCNTKRDVCYQLVDIDESLLQLSNYISGYQVVFNIKMIAGLFD